jgi:pantetheine-phosphate adenylyltransferase
MILTVAIFPGSFDPITNGHLDIIRRAAKLFDKLIVGVYDTPEKNLMFTIEERTELAKEAVKGISGVEVRSFSGLTVEFAKKVSAQAMVRGLRASSDFEWEFDLAMMTKKMCPELELVCLMASPDYQFLSSSLMKEVAMLGGDVGGWVPPYVAQALKKKVGKEM